MRLTARRFAQIGAAFTGVRASNRVLFVTSSNRITVSMATCVAQRRNAVDRSAIDPAHIHLLLAFGRVDFYQ